MESSGLSSLSTASNSNPSEIAEKVPDYIAKYHELPEAIKRSRRICEEQIKRLESAGHDMTPTYKDGVYRRLLRGPHIPINLAVGGFYPVAASATYEYSSPTGSSIKVFNRNDIMSKKSIENPTNPADERVCELTKDEKKNCSDDDVVAAAVVPNASGPNLTTMMEATEHKGAEEGMETAKVCESTKNKKRKCSEL